MNCTIFTISLPNNSILIKRKASTNLTKSKSYFCLVVLRYVSSCSPHKMSVKTVRYICQPIEVVAKPSQCTCRCLLNRNIWQTCNIYWLFFGLFQTSGFPTTFMKKRGFFLGGSMNFHLEASIDIYLKDFI